MRDQILIRWVGRLKAQSSTDLMKRRFTGPTHSPAPPMPGLNARLIAAQILGEVLASGRPLDEKFVGASAHPRLTELELRDRAFVRSIATVSLRRLGTIRQAISVYLEKGIPRKSGGLELILTIAAAQILFLDTPPHAAVNLAVQAARIDSAASPYAALVNAVLRRISLGKQAILDASDGLTIDTPPWLGARWRATYGDEQARAIANAHQHEPTLDLSVKSDAANWARRLGGILLPTGSIRLLSHTPIEELEAYDEGEWWVQDAAAALPARLLRAGAGMRVADLCAAPGGKSAEIALTGANLTAVDRSAERLKRLKANLERLRLRAEVAVSDVLSYDAPPFDAVLLDAPCSATGTIRRHPDVAWTKRPSDIVSLAQMQSRLLDKAIVLTKAGGTLVFCTCSLEPEEGENLIASLLRRNQDVRRIPIDAGEVGGLDQCITPAGDLRTLPSHLCGPSPRLSGLDGFYAARLQRRS
jgi:16S rRNA (cytosine967-C5)-methyltransferase